MQNQTINFDDGIGVVEISCAARKDENKILTRTLKTVNNIKYCKHSWFYMLMIKCEHMYKNTFYNIELTENNTFILCYYVVTLITGLSCYVISEHQA